jgi:hypothetical protein
MKVIRAALDVELKCVRDATWARQTRERDAVDGRTDAAIEQARERVEAVYRPKWRNLYFN